MTDEELEKAQLKLFEEEPTKKYKITNKIRLIELFGGIGSQAMALRDLGADFEHYRLVEFDPFPVKSYNAIHNTNFTPQDITKIKGSDLGIEKTNEYTYIMTYSFPCQDLSVAGKMRGMTKGSGTRSGLLWEVERLLNETENLPQVLLMENVPQVISAKNITDFTAWQDFLKSKGYTNYIKIINATDHKVPQNRKRCFMLSLLSKDDYIFEPEEKLETTVRDFLEDEVDEKYFINSEKTRKLIKTIENLYKSPVNEPICLNSKGGRAGIEGLQPSIQDRVYSADGPAVAVTTSFQPSYLIKQATKDGFIEMEAGGVADLLYPSSTTRRGRVQDGGRISPTITAENTGICRIEDEFRIRKLTPRECWRLMGYTDQDFEKAQTVNSNTQLYKEAGNAIVKQVLMSIFRPLLNQPKKI